jgi:hypothetical protein
MALTWLMATAVGATIVLWNRAFIELWVGATRYVGSVPNLLIMLTVTQLVLIRNDAFIIDLTLDLRRKVLLGALSAAVSLILSGLLVGVFNLGVTGLCLGFIAGRAILSLAYPWLIGRFLGISLFSQLASALRPALSTAVLFAAVLGMSELLTANTWLSLVFGVGLTLIVMAPLSFFAGLSGDQRKRIWQRARVVTRSVVSR